MSYSKPTFVYVHMQFRAKTVRSHGNQSLNSYLSKGFVLWGLQPRVQARCLEGTAPVSGPARCTKQKKLNNNKKTQSTYKLRNCTAECSLSTFESSNKRMSTYKLSWGTLKQNCAENFGKSMRVNGDRRHFPVRRFGRDWARGRAGPAGAPPPRLASRRAPPRYYLINSPPPCILGESLRRRRR